jgi:hypothetical protein
MLKIDKGVKVPESRNDYVTTIKSMEVGHSVLFDTEMCARSFQHRAKALKVKTTRRTVKEGVRVWRV